MKFNRIKIRMTFISSIIIMLYGIQTMSVYIYTSKSKDL